MTGGKPGQHLGPPNSLPGLLLGQPSLPLSVEGERILEVGGPEVQATTAERIDLKGMTLMPGLIDAHVHVTAVTADLSAMAEWSPTYVTARSAQVLRGMLSRGFTTVRDVAGADYGLPAPSARPG